MFTEKNYTGTKNQHTEIHHLFIAILILLQTHYFYYMWYQFLNIFFLIFHTVFTVFNMVGWAFKKTRRLHLITISVTAFSWFVLGIWYGWGYCFCTDWHWSVRQKLGFTDHSISYIHFLILQLTGADLNQQMVQHATLILFLLSFTLSIWFNVKDIYSNKRQ